MKKKNTIALTILLSGAVMSGSTVSVFNSEYYLNSFYNVNAPIISSEYTASNEMWDIPLFDNMVPQGITFIDDYIATTSYSSDKKANSCVYILDNEGQIINTCDIGNKAHVGGIAYDEANSLVWITGINGCVNAYSKNSILYRNSASPIYSNINVGKGLINYKNPLYNSVSFLTVYNNELYVGNFSLSNNAYIKKYEISINSRTKELTLGYRGSIKIPSKVQGVTFYEQNDNTYMLFSRSYGNGVDSLLQIYEYKEEIEDYNCIDDYVCIEMPAMLEQITVKGDKLYSIYESAADKYTNKKGNITDNICSLDIEPLVNKLALKKGPSR